MCRWVSRISTRRTRRIDGRAKPADARAGIEHQHRAFAPAHADAGRVAAVARRLRAGCGERAARAPERDLHLQISQKMLIAPRSVLRLADERERRDVQMPPFAVAAAHPHVCARPGAAWRAPRIIGRSSGGMGLRSSSTRGDARGPLGGGHFARLVEAPIEDRLGRLVVVDERARRRRRAGSAWRCCSRVAARG